MLLLINKTLGILTLISHIFLIIGVPSLFLKNANSFKIFFSKNGLLFAWLVSIGGTVTSLFYSEIAGFAPCELCWFQRIFMYPLVILLGIAYFKKDFKFTSYPITLAIIGAVIALYHNYIYYGGSSIVPCNAFGLGVSCTRRYVFEAGYITIPLMSLTAFLLIILFLYLQRLYTSHYVLQSRPPLSPPSQEGEKEGVG